MENYRKISQSKSRFIIYIIYIYKKQKVNTYIHADILTLIHACIP